MLKAYVSSTYKDLRDYRHVAVDTLERLGFVARAMEKYFATDERPLDMCLADVSQCDLYVGIFAWRYGFIPKERNPAMCSITECEYREAVRLGIPCLLFLSDQQTGKWQNEDPDDLSRITQLRHQLGLDRNLSFFDSPEKLGREISLAVFDWLQKPDFGRYLIELSAQLADLPPLPDGTKNFALNETIGLRVNFLQPDAEAPSIKKQIGETKLFELSDAVAKERIWLLVGEAGQGKSTALRSLAFYFATEWNGIRHQPKDVHAMRPALIPIYFLLSRKLSPLRYQIWSALQSSTFRCNPELLNIWLQDKPFLFLIDRLDETASDDVLDEVQALLRYAPNSRVVIASRPIANLSKWPWPKAAIQALSNSDLRCFLKKLLGRKSASDLCAALAQNGALDVFRRPLFARFLALSSPELARLNSLTLGEVFHDVFEKRFLGGWEPISDSQVDKNIIREITGRLAHDMVSESAYTIPREIALKKGLDIARVRDVARDLRYVEQIFNNILKHGLMQEQNGELQFWHSSFRDYFAAVWLHQRGSGLGIYFRSWVVRWHECLFYYYGLLSPESSERRLRQLLFAFKCMLLPLSLNPFVSLTRRCFFILRCLAQNRYSPPSLRRQLIRKLPVHRNIFLQKGDYAPHHYGASVKDVYTEFCDLVGQLAVPEAFDYLKKLDWHFVTVAPGLMYDQTDEIVTRIVAFISAKTEVNDWFLDTKTTVSPNLADVHDICEAIVQSPDPRFIQKIEELLDTGDVASKIRVLKALTSSLISRFGDSKEPDLGIDIEDRLTLRLIGLALNEEDEKIRDSARDLLSAFGRMHNRDVNEMLPTSAKQAFLAALTHPKWEIRHRAILGLWYFPLASHLDTAWRLLDDSEIKIVLQMLLFFWIKDQRRFPIAVLKVLRRKARVGTRERELLQEVRIQLREAHKEPRSHLRCLLLLTEEAFFAENYTMRLYSTQALGELGVPWTYPLLQRIFREGEWGPLRAAALTGLTGLLAKEAEALIVEGLDDQSPEVRAAAVHACRFRKFGDEFRQRVGPTLFQLLKDSSDEVADYSAMQLKDWGFLAEDWYHFRKSRQLQTEPVYLGPRAPESSLSRSESSAQA
jgi:hypothetical protein